MRDRTLSRPAWSLGAFRRKIQISPHTLHLVVEGIRNDTAYYGKIAETSGPIRKAGYEFTRISTVYPGGGKAAMLRVFDALKSGDHLVQEVSTGKRVVVFIFDRDAENVVGGSKRNSHIFYTTGYDVESDVYSYGQDEVALANAAGVSPLEARILVAALGDWRQKAADDFRDWVHLCCLAKRLGVACETGYGRHAVTKAQLRNAGNSLPIIRKNCKLSASKFVSTKQSIESRVDALFNQGNGFRLIKGKWLPMYLKALLALHESAVTMDLNGIENRLTVSYMASLDPRGSWPKRYVEGWELLMA